MTCHKIIENKGQGCYHKKKCDGFTNLNELQIEADFEFPRQLLVVEALERKVKKEIEQVKRKIN